MKLPRSMEGSNTTFASTTSPSASRPTGLSQAHKSNSVPVAPIVGGVIVGLLKLGAIACSIQCNLRKRRSKAQEPHGTALQQHLQQSGINQDDIAAHSLDRDSDAKLEQPSVVHLRYAENATSTPGIQDSLEGLYVASVLPYKPKIEPFTTDQSVVASNRRLQEEGRWETDESLPGYPGSDQGRSR
ncbi:hypothetical protein PM082_018709 [Marasmius tenuissimus]|nr:hypothetical protein PM082_018709 [Marasmius tenuissimus]